MKNLIRTIPKISLWLLRIVIFFLIFMTVYHRIMLKKEEKLIVPNGKIISVNGHNLHVYAEGKKNNKPTLIVMASSGVAAPVYDYKVLYSKLSDEYRIAVVEKFGYGYSDVAGVSGDIDSMLEVTREALKIAGEEGPYVLLPHSMSGLEAVYWAQTYPDEVYAIIGLDMAISEGYENVNINNSLLKIRFLKTATYMGVHRIPLLNLVSELGLTKTEIQQQKYLLYRNTLNDDVFAECKSVFKNANKVGQGVIPNKPMLLFSSNGEGTGLSDNWVTYQKKFASQSDKIRLIQLDCSHNIHYYKSEFIAQNAKEFLQRIFRK